MSDTNASWHPDPTGRHDHRYWDGSQWTENVADAGIASIDPLHHQEPVVLQPEVVTPVEAVAEAEPVAPVVPIGYAQDAPLGEEPSFTDQPAYGSEPTFAEQPAYGTEPTDTDDQPAFGSEPTFAEQPALGSEPTFAEQPALGSEPTFAEQPAYGSEAAYSDETVVDQEPVGADATASYPAAADPAAWPTATALDAPSPPPPYVPADPGSPSTDESKKRLLIGGGILAAIILIAIVFFAFGGDGDSPSAQDKISDSADTTDTTVPPPDGSYGSDPELDALYDSCDSGDFAACDQLYSASPSGSEYQSFGDTCGGRNDPGGYCVDIHADGTDDGAGDGGSDGTELEQNLADTFEVTLGLSRDKAECLAGKLNQAVEEGSITAEQATAGFVKYLSDCDITLEEIGAN